MDNDTAVPMDMREWLSRQILELIGDGKCGATAPVSNWSSGLQSMAHDKTIQRPVHYSKYLIGFCTVFNRAAFDKACGGKLDEQFHPGYNVDLDFSIALRKAGYGLKIIRSIFIHHEGGKSIETTCSLTEEDARTRKLLIEKWGKETVDDLFSISENFLLTGSE
jgi:GT2 family glycosyltransferase